MEGGTRERARRMLRGKSIRGSRFAALIYNLYSQRGSVTEICFPIRVDPDNRGSGSARYAVESRISRVATHLVVVMVVVVNTIVVEDRDIARPYLILLAHQKKIQSSAVFRSGRRRLRRECDAPLIGRCYSGYRARPRPRCFCPVKIQPAFSNWRNRMPQSKRFRFLKILPHAIVHADRIRHLPPSARDKVRVSDSEWERKKERERERRGGNQNMIRGIGW